MLSTGAVLLWISEKMVGVCLCVQCICYTDFYLDKIVKTELLQ